MPRLRHLLVAASLALSAAAASAEPPKQLSVDGLAIGQTPDAARTILTKRYPSCALLPSVFHESTGYPKDVLAILDIGRGTLDTCRAGPAGRETDDEATLMFVHPSLASNQPLYQIDVQRSFPDAALVKNSKILYPFDKIRAELFRTYGRPTEERKEKITSAAASFERGLSVGGEVKREDYLVRYLWANRGHLDANLESATCDCGPRYVKADLEISRSPSTNPKSQFFVLKLRVVVRDSELGDRQDEWNAQWQKKS